jgi:putative ABC transport system permease protein
MSLLLRIAWRNIVRNRRRSLMTASAVAAGALAMLLFLGYTTYIFLGMETGNVQRIGHLSVFRSGYFLYGTGNSAAYGIDRYGDVIGLIADDPVLRPMVNVLTPTQLLMGIAANYSGDNAASRTFIGIGLVPSDRDRMRRWDPYGTGNVFAADRRISDSDESRGLIGTGLARILNLCAPLALPDCPPASAPGSSPDRAAVIHEDLTELAGREASATPTRKPDAPRIDLLAATVGGAPNVVSLNVSGAQPQGAKEIDDAFVLMHLGLAQQLVYGRSEHKATSIVIQLHRSQDMARARVRLAQLFREHQLDLDIRDFGELTPFYGQVIRMFTGIFVFIALVMGMIVLFAVVNTMTMNVMERTNEIGTIRAMGLRRGQVRAQFIAEGALIGVIGATLGAVLAFVIAAVVNASGLTWIPPGNSVAIPLHLDVLGRPALALGAWLVLVLVAVAAALLPANRAARLSVVDALRHV